MEYTVNYYLFDKGETVSEGICFTSQSKMTGLKSQLETLTFLERTKMVKLYIQNNNTTLLILKTSLSLKMSYASILIDMIIMTI